MELALPVLISLDERERYEVLLPGISERKFHGPSLAALLDDVALHLMETIPKSEAADMAAFELCPHVELRKPKVTIEVPTGHRKDTIKWAGRMSVVLSRWPEDEFWVATVPRLGTEKFAVTSTGALEATLARHLVRIAEKRGTWVLDQAVCAKREHLEILGVDTDLPTILPSQPIRRKEKKKRSKKTKKERDAEAAKKKEEEKEKKRRLIPPIALREVATNLTHRAIDGRLGRAHLQDTRVEDILGQLDHGGAAILLVGPSGVGKTAVVHEVVRRLALRARTIQDRRDVWQVDGNRIIAGMSVVGAWEARVRAMVHELTERQDILYVNDLPALVHTGRSAHSDTNVAEFLEPHLARGDLRIIGECTPERLLAAREEAPGFFARFRISQMMELSEREAMLVLVHQSRTLSGRERAHVEPEALESVLALTRRFEARRAHPGKAVSLLARVVADHAEPRFDELGRRVVDRRHVIEAYARETGLPRFVLWEADARPLRDIEAFFERRIIAQPKAVEAALDVVAVLEQGLNDPTRPIATFLFVGPTGVGKTETAKAIAELLFGSPDRLVRFDMSELITPDSVARLFGDRLRPDGELTRRIEQQPFSVILLDEIEKAHPMVFDALLQVLGEGRLTNAAGRTIDFTSTVIIMTSNLGVREASRHLGFGEPTAAALDEHYKGAAERWFRPEFVNRIDRVVPFSALGREAITPLVGRLLEQMLSRRGLRRQSIVVDVDPALVDLVVDQGFDPRYGARSVKRVLEAKLAVPLARHLVARQGSALTVVELFPRGQGLDLEVKELFPRAADGAVSERAVEETGWAAFEARHRRAMQILSRLEESDEVVALAHEHGLLVAKQNEAGAEAMSAADRDRLEILWTVLAELRPVGPLRPGEPRAFEPYDLRDDALRGDLEELARAHLERDEWEEHLRVEEIPGFWDYEHTKTVYAMDVRPLRTARGPLRPQMIADLEALELRLASVAYRVRAVHEAEHRLLLRTLPISSGREAGRFAWSVMDRLATAWSTWGSVRRMFRGEHGAWVDDDPAQREDEFWPTAAAVELVGPGLRSLLARDLGYWVKIEELGADRVTHLVLLEDVDDGSPAGERLAALDRAREEDREARRGGTTPEPSATAPIVRTIDRGRWLDPSTGEPTGEDLAQQALRRLLRTLEDAP